MKKKILLSIVILFVLFVGLIHVNATPLFSGANGKNATAPNPDHIPADGETVYATVSDGFDFSPVRFNAVGGGYIQGMSDLEKIIIGRPEAFAAANTITNNNDAKKTLEQLFGNYWFTAYCLDVNRKYPLTGLFNSDAYALSVDASGNYDNSHPTELYAALMYAILSNDNTIKVNSKTIAEDLEQVEHMDLSKVTIAYNTSSSEYAVMLSSSDYDDFFTRFMGGTGTTTDIGVNYIGFTEFTTGTPKYVFYTADDSFDDAIHGDFGTTNVTIKRFDGVLSGNDFLVLNNVSLNNLAFVKYTANADTSVLEKSKYEHALWIVENSYPTISNIDEFLSKAGITVSTFESEIRSLYGSAVTDSNIATYKQNVVYGLVQYAIWKVIDIAVPTGTGLDSKKLGSSLTTTGALNDLYVYLTKDRDVYDGYSSGTYYSKNISVSYPATGKELYKTTDTEYIYGPFKASYVALLEDPTQEITVTITNSDATNIRVIKADGTTTTTKVAKDENFYIGVGKNVNVGNVTASLSISNVISLADSRGRIYNPATIMAQNALSGGVQDLVTINGNLTVATNPKTGVQNIALLLMVTLVAFTLGYLVLSYKQKPIGLEQ